MAPIAPHFPRPPTVGTADEGTDSWRLARRWSGYPELEWTFGIFIHRIAALGGATPAYFYEDISDFDTTRLLVRMSNVLLSQREPSYPTVGLEFAYFDSAYRTVDGRLACDDTPFRGGHSVMAVDHDGLDEIRFVNTWNPPHFERHVEAVFAAWSARGGPSTALRRCMERVATQRLPEQDRLVHCWPARNTFTTQQVSTHQQQFTMLHWRVYSMASNSLVDVVELRDENEAVGRAHLFHGDVGAATLRELFVRPERRREGIGSLLEGTLAEWARHSGYDSLQVWLREPDARASVIDAPLVLAGRLGYDWEDVEMRRPNIIKIASRRL
jgi:GNAT superfamily N-acetyltransferase